MVFFSMQNKLSGLLHFVFCIMEECLMPIKYFLNKTQQNGVLCFEKITFDEDSPNYKYDIKTMGSIHQLRKSGYLHFLLW